MSAEPMFDFDEERVRARWTRYANESEFGDPTERAEWIEFAVSRSHGQHVYQAIEGPAFAKYEVERKRARREAAKVEGPMRQWLDKYVGK